MDSTKLNCEVCGDSSFTLKDGFFFCDECGTQTQATRDVEVDEEFTEGANFNKAQKFKGQNLDLQHELTSWECFNYVLLGLVEELIELGAKQELKTVTLQLWTAYLRKMEIAFFDKKNSALPKLGPLFSKRDAEILYNRRLTKEKKRKRKRSFIVNEKKRLKKQKRDLAQVEYQELSSEYNTTATYNSSSSAPSSRAIRLEFSRTARKIFKKLMPKDHLDKHAADYENILDCHDLTSKRARMVPKKIKKQQLTRKTIYTILYLALNLIGDDIQLTDMLRFMRDGFLSTTKISHFFPDNVAERCVKVVHSRDSSRQLVFTDSSIRGHAAFLCKLINISELMLPNIHKLVERYLVELRLPSDIAIYVERLLNFCPPKMEFRPISSTTPCFEGRAMAYIIFILKLLFGLDDFKEKQISLSAKRLNKELEKLGQRRLFVWEQWRNYIEMRKIILAQCHCPTSLFLNEQINMFEFIDFMQNEQEFSDQFDAIHNVIERMQKMFESLNFQSIKKEENSQWKFPPSMTQNITNFECILQNPPDKVYIPNYMYGNHAMLDIAPFLRPSKLKNILKENRFQVNIKHLECNSNRNVLGIFANYNHKERTRYFDSRIKTADFDISEEIWMKNIPEYKELKVFQLTTQEKQKRSNMINTKKSRKKPQIQLLREKILELLAERKEQTVTSKDNSNASTSTSKSPKRTKSLAKEKELTSKISKNIPSSSNSTAGKTLQLPKPVGDNSDLGSIRSYDIFSEMDMNPLDESLNEPRKIAESENDLFADVSDDVESQDSDSETFSKKVQFTVSALDYWTLMGEVSELTNTQFKVITNHLPTNFLWLLDICSQTIGMNSKDLLQEILTVESYFIYYLDGVKNFRNLVFTNKQVSNNKELANCIAFYKDLW